ncbi:LOW QUALITY PROTEIN: hypothetical protein PHMEG_00014593 [Phytophthora megakarya]|uniref:Chromo domain-containing protein n=1 Tax=Phytophthora megakarya TaxID=4795 RepID=A0A225W5H5_9STRA|nr:LOW QUALITY PROTEIN: hypothetical protein PHMEG_00014593 [Phytophthora megakarya]
MSRSDRNRTGQVFEVGDRVYLSTKHLDLKHTRLPNSTKAEVDWPVHMRKVRNHAYKLNIQAGNTLHPVFNTGSLKPYKEPSRLSKPNKVVLADGSVEQLVQQLLGKHHHNRRTQFLVEWVGEEKAYMISTKYQI